MLLTILRGISSEDWPPPCADNRSTSGVLVHSTSQIPNPLAWTQNSFALKRQRRLHRTKYHSPSTLSYLGPLDNHTQHETVRATARLGRDWRHRLRMAVW